MTLTNLCGKVAIGVSVAIVLIFLILFVLAAFCVGIGAYESVTGTANSTQTQQDYQNLSEQINQGAGQIQHVQPFTTQYWPEETPIQINKTGA